MKLNKFNMKNITTLLISIILCLFSTNISRADIDESLAGSLANIKPYGSHFVSVLDNGQVYDYRFSPNGASMTYRMIAGGNDTETVRTTVAMTKPGIYLVAWYSPKKNETVTQLQNFTNFRTDNIYSYETATGQHRIEYHSGIISPVP